MPFEGPAVERPFNGVIPDAAQALRGAVSTEELAAGAGAGVAEDLAVGAGVAEVAGASMLVPGIGVGIAALAAGSGLYHYAKKYLDEGPNDRRGKIIVDNMQMRQNRAEGLTNQTFDDNGKYAEAFSV